jgi:thiol-disulfide isomerase/thioredoxin
MRPRIWEAALILCLLAALVMVGRLTRQNSLLRESGQAVRERLSFPEVGQFLPPAPVFALDGSEAQISTSGAGPEVLLFLTTTCPYCLRTLPVWTAIADSLAAAGVTVRAISLDSLPHTNQYVADNDFAVPTYVMLDQRYRTLYRAGAVPATIVVAPDGLVRFAHRGVIAPGSAPLDSVMRIARSTALPATMAGTQR